MTRSLSRQVARQVARELRPTGCVNRPGPRPAQHHHAGQPTRVWDLTRSTGVPPEVPGGDGHATRLPFHGGADRGPGRHNKAEESQ